MYLNLLNHLKLSNSNSFSNTIKVLKEFYTIKLILLSIITATSSKIKANTNNARFG